MTPRPRVTLIGAGSFAAGLAPVLRKAGYVIDEIISRRPASSRLRARRLAKEAGARAVTLEGAAFEAPLLWFCVPDREIRAAARDVARGELGRVRFAFHSSGALLSSELEPLRELGIATASVHPLMTFVPDSQPSLEGVPFALEGDAAAVRLARRTVRRIGGESFLLAPGAKTAYHAWATMTSPLQLAFLVTLEEAARAAGLSRAQARRMSFPIIRQTLTNYARLGPDASFSGPIIRGDAAIVAQHLSVMRKAPRAREVYLALARAALRLLPTKNRSELERLLRS